MYRFGKPKDLGLITKQDVLDNKVWIWVWETDLEPKYPEDFQVPIIDLEDLQNTFSEPIITLKIENTDIIASASYDFCNDSLSAISIWEEEKWVTIENSSITEPIIFTSLIKIGGVERKQFICKSKTKDRAYSL